MLKKYGTIAVDVVVAVAAYYFIGWIGLVAFVIFMFSLFFHELIQKQDVIMKTLLSRLPDRCAVCHREIVDEGGVIDDDGEHIYHGTCIDKLEAFREKEAANAG